MSMQWMKTVFLGSVLCGLCLCASANTTDAPVAASPESGLQPKPSTKVALVLPLRSDTLREAAQAVRAGFMAAYEHESADTEVSVIETDDAAQNILSGYTEAVAKNDIVVGPLSRSGVAAVAQSNQVFKPTVALTPPEGEGAILPQQMLVMGLSIEDEARQVAAWAGADKNMKKAFVFYTTAPWQRRAAKAFEAQWKLLGNEAESIELAANDGYLNGRVLLQLKHRIQPDKSALLFAALDVRQTRQLRATLGNAMLLYGTSQLNPLVLGDSNDEQRIEDLNGVRLLDIPWQLQPEHPAVMAYSRPAADADSKRSADLERLYALGIDAFRVAREIAAHRDSFELDGVTGALKVSLGGARAQFTRTTVQAVYRNGSVVPEGEAQ